MSEIQGETETPFFTSQLSDINIPSSYPPLGLLYIASSLERNGHKVEIIDLSKENRTVESLINKMSSFDAIGFSVYYVDYLIVEKIIRMIKEFDPKITLIIGGPFCTFMKKRSLLEIPFADICVTGEGEEVIIDIVRYLEGKKKLSDINGIYYREGKQIKKGKPLRVIKDLDSINFPARHLIDKYEYGKISNLTLLKPKVTAMITSRGCPFKCKFCGRYGNVIKGWGFRQRSAENVVEELIKIDKKYGSVIIYDDCFLVDKKRSHQIMDNLIEVGTKIELMIEGIRVDSEDIDLYRKMKKANVKLVSFGIESGNQEVIDFYNKKFTLEQARNAVKLSRKMGFLTFSTFILGGSSIETENHIKNTIKFACSLPLDLVNFVPLYYQKGSALWNEEVKNKKISKDEYTVMADSRRGLGNFTPEELVEFRNSATRRFYLRPGYILDQVYQAFLRKNFNLLRYGIKLINRF
jgi:radical SAM superfamily enzyme YgiQ (UPF0313 family)